MRFVARRGITMINQFQDLDLQDIHFLIEPSPIESAIADADEDCFDPTVVMPTSIDAEKCFPLINTILPFEACLYHELLPLYIEGRELYLGMVSLEDMAALGYARQIVSYLKYQIVPQTISAETHQQVLSHYLSQQNQHNNHQSSRNHQSSQCAVVESAASIAPIPTNQRLATITAPQYAADAIPGNALPQLHFEQPTHPGQRSLSPTEFLHALLLRMIGSGIGRLFFVPQADGGKILWTENGQVKTILENLPSDTFQGMIAALKTLTHLPSHPVTAPVEAEIERLHERQRILLRLRISPKPQGEEATIQVLHGTALKFYQKHQLQALSRDAQTIVAQLEQKLNAINQRREMLLSQSADEAGTLDRDPVGAELDQVIANLEQQLVRLKQVRAGLDLK
jgi:hypothetical protein